MDAGFDLIVGQISARSEPLFLNLRAARHDNHLVVVLVGSDLDHQRRIHNGDGMGVAPLDFFEPLLLTFDYRWVDQRMEALTSPRIFPKNDVSQNSPIDRSIR